VSNIRQLYDEETGTPDESVPELLLTEVEQSLFEEATAVVNVTGTKGYEIFEAWLSGVIADCTHKLVDENDYRTIVRMQQQVRAYSNVLGFFEQKRLELQNLKDAQAERASQPSQS
jgi:hypothetical protein